MSPGRTLPMLASEPPQRVLIIVTRRIGDVLLAMPVVRSVKRAWPGSKIDLLVFAGTDGFVRASSDVDRILAVPPRPRMIEHLRFMAGLARRYDLALSLVPGDRPTIYAWLAGRRRAGLLLPSCRERWKQRLLHAWVPFDNDNTHTVLMHLALLKLLDVPPVYDPAPAWSQEEARAASRLLEPIAGVRYAVLHPYPQFRYKMWNEADWSEVGRWLVAQGIAVVTTGGPDRAEREYVRRVAHAIPGALDASGALTLGSVAWLVSGAAVYVGPDTAVTHAAAALGVPTIALYGPTNPVKWGPWPRGHRGPGNPWLRHGSQSRGRVRLIQGPAPCVPCALEGCERHVESASECLRNLAPRTVMAAIRDVLDDVDERDHGRSPCAVRPNRTDVPRAGKT